MQAPAPSLKIMLSLSKSSMTLLKVSVPMIKQVDASPALKKEFACITPCIHPGQPNKISYGMQYGFLIPSPCLTLDAKDGTLSD